MMSFGLNIMPRIFTKLAKVMVHRLTAKGVQVLAYLVDWLIKSQSEAQCVYYTETMLKVCCKMDLKVNN